MCDISGRRELTSTLMPSFSFEGVPAPVPVPVPAPSSAVVIWDMLDLRGMARVSGLGRRASLWEK